MLDIYICMCCNYIWCSVGHPPSPAPMGMGGQYRLVLLVPPCGLWWWYVGMLVCMLVCMYVCR